MKLLIINGPNLNMLGIREKHLYGARDYAALCEYVKEQGRRLGVEVELFQSNHEGALVDCIQAAYQRIDGIVINPGAYTHTSVALLDALKAVDIPACEVHLTDVNAREEFRKISYVRLACKKTFAGYGFDGYRMAMEYLAGKQAE
ncbi:MAG: type II 3-dehydroquinate dehydratase [Clostridia bacterium]|nr:type II 3-dehydroquinate dehydratase [Clostridiales bacterium]MDO4828093.1 type II 3-dehydroquinate dehydratase [Clostridia bacterium]MDY2770791.1 type II 3-dehydroquinate dehydratase [Eubacteriales bacterium]